MRTIYAIAKETHVTYGHGDAGTELRIVRDGWGSGPFPPAFTLRSLAEEWLKQNPRWGDAVVELELIDM